MEKLQGTSMNIVQDNIEKLKEIFPEIFTEGKIDFEVLKQLLGEKIEIDKERYSFTWKGKTKARQVAQQVSTGTLRPSKEDSKNWDDTENLYIEGDNLEVLKLMQKSYHGKIKMIYIDPPYNTGKDFIYRDNFRDSVQNYLELTGQVCENSTGGYSLTTNKETNGRYHSDWLNMMYPRLKLARNLLTDDGVIFISIDDNEVTNLKKICDEIFGEKNIIALLPWKKKQGGGNDSKFFVQEHEYILSVAKNIENFKLGLDKFHKLDEKLYPYKDKEGEYGLVTLDKSSLGYIESLDFEIKDREGNSYFPRNKNGEKKFRWRWGKEKVEKEFDKLVFKDGKVYTKYRKPEGVPPRSLLIDTRFGRTEVGKEEVKEILGNGEFSYPKPIGLIKHFIHLINENNFFVLDFFSGSATTAHAVMQLNAEDGGNRKYIMVQLPEPCDEKSEAYKAGYKNICEIGKERIRRAGDMIKDELQKENAQLKLGEESKKLPDIGFKVFKLDSSNIKEWDPETDDLKQTLLDSIDNIKSDRNSLDVLYEIILKYGLDLNVPIEEKEDFYSIGGGTLLVNLNKEIDMEVIDSICEEYRNLLEIDEDFKTTVVLRDSAFKDDVDKTNAMKKLEQAGIKEVRSI